jgi:hypothetical protein
VAILPLVKIATASATKLLCAFENFADGPKTKKPAKRWFCRFYDTF